jgi:alanyl-tRNA synthetase
MTERLYQNNCYLFEFESKVVAVNKIGTGYEIILEKSAFYPEAGGQLADKGILGGQVIEDVVERDNGEIIHIVKNWDITPGQAVVGTIDRIWRLDNMRKHTGQHILSQAFVAVAGAETVSSRLGEAESTIELSAGSLPDEIIQSVENLANDVIREDKPVTINYYSRSELMKFPIRKIPDREGQFRIVQIGEFDYTACGGTHLKRSGEVGLIKIVGQEKMRGHLRVIFLAGRQAAEDYREKHQVIGRLSSNLTCHFRDLEKSIERLTEQNISLRRENSVLGAKLLSNDLQDRAQDAICVNGVKIISAELDEYDIKIIKDAGFFVTGTERSVFLALCSDKMLIMVSNQLRPDAGTMARIFMEKFGGKGGGNPSSAQVGGLPLEKRSEYLNSFIELLKSELKN